jgi:hypothetical protein
MTVRSEEEEKKLLLVVETIPATFTWCTRFLRTTTRSCVGERLSSTVVKAPRRAIVVPRYLTFTHGRTSIEYKLELGIEASEMMALAKSDSWQRYGLKRDSRQRIALTASFP